MEDDILREERRRREDGGEKDKKAVRKEGHGREGREEGGRKEREASERRDEPEKWVGRREGKNELVEEREGQESTASPQDKKKRGGREGGRRL